MILRVLGALLRANDLERYVIPGLADAQHEGKGIAAATLRAMIITAWLLLRERARIFLRTPWIAMAPAAAPGAIGVWAMRAGEGTRADGERQAIFLALAAVIALLVATTPRRWLVACGDGIGIAGLVLVAAPLLGGETPARWIHAGPLVVQTSTLAAPMLIAACAWGKHGKPLVTAAVLLLALQPDGATAVALAAGAMVALRSPSLLALAATAAAVLRDPALQPVAHVEGAIGFVAGMSAKAAALATCALAVLPAVPLMVTRDRALGRGMAALLGAWVALPLAGSQPVPLVGYGGSFLVASFLALSFSAARE